MPTNATISGSAGGGVPDTTLYDRDGALTSNRTVDFGGFDLIWDNSGGEEFRITGKLTVDGLIDPTGLVFTGPEGDAGMPANTIYVTDGSASGLPSGELIFKDGGGTYHRLENQAAAAAGGQVDTVSILTDGTATGVDATGGTPTDPIFDIRLRSGLPTNDLVLAADGGLHFDLSTHNLGDLGNVLTAGALAGQALVFDGTDWGPATIAAGGGTLNSVSITTDGDVVGVTPGGTATDPTFNLVLRGTTGGNDLTLDASGGVFFDLSTWSIGELSDVDLAGINNGWVLKWDGTGFIAARDDDTTYAAGLGIDISAGNVVSLTAGLGVLADVDLAATPPAANDVLTFDGTEWVPVAPTVGIASVTIQTDGTALGVDTTGSTATALVFDLLLRSNDADNELTIGLDGGLYYKCENLNVVTDPPLGATLDLDEPNTLMRITNAAIVPALPSGLNAATIDDVGKTFYIANRTAGIITINAFGVTVNGGLNLPSGAVATAIVVGVNEWDIVGGS